MKFQLLRPTILLSAALLALSGCNDNSEITVYRIPKETKAAAPQQGAMNAAPGAAVRWTAPAGWQEQPATGFRKGSFKVAGADGQIADVSIISFPQTAGGLLANVNRWRGQLKLAPVPDAAAAATPMSVGGNEMFIVDIVSEQPILKDGMKSRILGGILQTSGETWFFKMSGEDKLVASQRETFHHFLEGLEIGGATPGAAMGTDVPTPPPLAPSEKPSLRYDVPPGWQKQPLSSMRAASFKVAGKNRAEADISVVFLAGMAGGDLANVNRWRDQLNLAPIDEQGLAQTAVHMQANNHDFLVVDMVSDAPIGQRQEKTRILAAILDENNRAWFIKMTGEDALVASQKNAFSTFLSTLGIP